VRVRGRGRVRVRVRVGVRVSPSPDPSPNPSRDQARYSTCEADLRDISLSLPIPPYISRYLPTSPQARYSTCEAEQQFSDDEIDRRLAQEHAPP